MDTGNKGERIWPHESGNLDSKAESPTTLEYKVLQMCSLLLVLFAHL